MPSKSPDSIRREQDTKELLEFLKWLKKSIKKGREANGIREK